VPFKAQRTSGAFFWCLCLVPFPVPLFGAFFWCLCLVPFPVPLFGAFFWCLSPGSTKAPSHPVVPFLGAFDKGTGKGTKPVPFLGAFVVLVPFFGAFLKIWCSVGKTRHQCRHLRLVFDEGVPRLAKTAQIGHERQSPLSKHHLILNFLSGNCRSDSTR